MNNYLDEALRELDRAIADAEKRTDVFIPPYAIATHEAIALRDHINALAAHVARLREALSQSLIAWGYEASQGDGIMEEHGSVYEECNKRCDEDPAASLDRLKAKWQSEALEGFGDKWDWERPPTHKDFRHAADIIRRQAEGGDGGPDYPDGPWADGWGKRSGTEEGE